MSEHMTTFAELVEMLNATGIPFAAYAWVGQPDAESWGVVSIDGGNSLPGDDTHAEECLEGTIDLFTRQLDATAFTAVNDRLKTADIAYRLNSVQYEQERRLIHYEWVWQGAATNNFE